MIRRWFYLVLGFTFPFFWAIHAAGTFRFLYYPLQVIASTTTSGWPSFVTATLLYVIVAAVFEITYRARRNISPE